MPYETRWTGDSSLFTVVVYGDGSAYEAKTRTCAWQVGVWWRPRAPGSPSRSLERCRSSSKMSMGQSDSGFSCSCAVRAPAQYVTDSSFVEQGVNQRGRVATVTSTSAWADLWRDAWCETPQGAFARQSGVQSTRRAVSAQAQQAPECAAQRDGSGLAALQATELLISCREARCEGSAPCVVRTVATRQMP